MSSVNDDHLSGERSASGFRTWMLAAGVSLLGAVLALVSTLVTIASGDGFSLSLWDFNDAPVDVALLDQGATWITGFAIYVGILSVLVGSMAGRRAAPGLRRALAYTQALVGIGLFGVTIAILRLDIWGISGVSPSIAFSLLAFVGSLLIAAGGMVGALSGISGSAATGTSVWFFLSVRGRISRQGWWVAYVTLLAFAYTLAFTLAVISVWLLLPLWLALIYVLVCVDGKRWHDRGRSAWWVALYAIPLVGAIWSFVELGFLRGTQGTNAFGDKHHDLDV